MSLFSKLFDKLLRKNTVTVSQKNIVEQPQIAPELKASIKTEAEQEKIESKDVVEQPQIFPEFKVTIKTEVVQKEIVPKSFTPLDFGKTAGVLGCYLNYNRYKIIGTREPGKRITRIRTGIDKEQAIERASEEGLLPPFKVEQLEHELPTERQINYLKDLGVLVPDGITKDDASYMIGRALGEDSLLSPHPSMVALANGLKTRFSAFIGAEGLLSAIIHQADNRERAALYAYAVRQSMRGSAFKNMLEDPQLPVYFAFADTVLANPALMRSLQDRPPEDYKKPYRGTAIYKAAVAYLTGGDKT